MVYVNCQPDIHQMPDGTPINLVPGMQTTCQECGFTFTRTEPVLGKLAMHVDFPSGRVRAVLFDHPAICVSCESVAEYWFLPCGEEGGGLFTVQAEPAIALKK